MSLLQEERTSRKAESMISVFIRVKFTCQKNGVIDETHNLKIGSTD
jgi:hypothetical protein